MTFAIVHGEYLTLKKRLTMYVGSSAFSEITIDTPKGSNDELSFLRLVSWAYVLIHENGKVPLDFLKKLAPINCTGQLLPHVRKLRTWMSHNLSFDKTADVKTLTAVVAWFQKTCGVGTPVAPEHWDKCFTTLCKELAALLSGAVSACDCLASPEDGQMLVEDLKNRVNRKWDAYRFDVFVEEAVKRLGYSGIDVVAFRTRHLEEWRKVIADSAEDAASRLISLRIESDILQTMAEALPLTIRDLLYELYIPNTEQLSAALLLIRDQRKKIGSDFLSYLTEVLEDIPKLISVKSN